MSIAFHPLNPYLGVRIEGIDLRQALSDEVAETLREALARHRLLVLRQPGLSTEDQLRFTRVFGEVYASRAYKGEMGDQGYYFSNTRADGQLGTGELSYHHDHLFNPNPCRAAVLYAIEVPESGSATKFRDAVEMARRIPAELQAQVRQLRCLHLLDYASISEKGRVDLSEVSPKALRSWQPLVWTDPESGREALWLVPLTTIDFEGIEREAGYALIDALWSAADAMTDIEYVHQWHKDDLLIWDNRLLSHARMPFNDTEPRTLRRTTVR